MAIALGFALLAQRTPLDDEPVLRAAANPQNDPDGDGLCELAELALGTSPDALDSDGDGFSDPEELARGSSPAHFLSRPDPVPATTVGMTLYQKNSRLHVVISLYVRDNHPRTKGFSVGMLAPNNRLISFPMSYLMYAAEVSRIPTTTPGETLLVLDWILSPTYIYRTGAMSLFATLKENGTIVSAAALNLFHDNGLILNRVMDEAWQGNMGQANSAIYLPIAGTESAPSNWRPGEVCAQSMVVVGVSGAVVTQEVVSAGCRSGWDSYCDPFACSTSVGTAVKVIDPAALTGG